MYELLHVASENAVVIILIAAFLDTFFLSGLLLYGAAMMSTVGMLHTSGMITTPQLILAAYIGTTLSNYVNFGIGYYFGQYRFVAKRLQSKRMDAVRRRLETHGLFWGMCAARFIAVTRPVYSIVLGGMHTNWRIFILYEALIALVWVLFWLVILLFGEEIYFSLFGA